jgi:hypothetical protein
LGDAPASDPELALKFVFELVRGDRNGSRVRPAPLPAARRKIAGGR